VFSTVNLDGEKVIISNDLVLVEIEGKDPVREWWSMGWFTMGDRIIRRES